MAFWYLNKITGEALIFGGITIMAKETGIKANILFETFSRQKKREFENESVRIVKTELKRGGN